MKYCIGCVHLDLMPGYEGTGGGTYTGPGCHFPPELLCRKGHWEAEKNASYGDHGLPIADHVEIVDIERSMSKAETCPDFDERSPSTQQVTP